MGYDNAQKVHVNDTPWGVLGGEIVQRAGLFMLDYFLFTVLGPWPMDFFIGSPSNPTSPARWRWRVGFKDTEVVVRRSRRWDEALQKSSTEWAAIDRDEGAVMKDRIMPAVSPRWLRDKTGYLMMDKSWDLDFAAMVTAHSCISAGQCSLSDFRTAVCAHTEGQGWLVWEVWKLEADSEGEEKRRRIVAMKDRLTAMGKENLFFRWVEMVQFESSVEGGFTRERQRGAVEKARAMFQEQRVDFEGFWDGIDGGVEGMPGMEVVT